MSQQMFFMCEYTEGAQHQHWSLDVQIHREETQTVYSRHRSHSVTDL